MAPLGLLLTELGQTPVLEWRSSTRSKIKVKQMDGLTC
jgi:hypothetical protein